MGEKRPEQHRKGILLTRCGCSAMVNIEQNQEFIYVPLMSRRTQMFSPAPVMDQPVDVVIDRRNFRADGFVHIPGFGEVPIYRECE